MNLHNFSTFYVEKNTNTIRWLIKIIVKNYRPPYRSEFQVRKDLRIEAKEKKFTHKMPLIKKP